MTALLVLACAVGAFGAMFAAGLAADMAIAWWRRRRMTVRQRLWHGVIDEARQDGPPARGRVDPLATAAVGCGLLAIGAAIDGRREIAVLALGAGVLLMAWRKR